MLTDNGSLNLEIDYADYKDQNWRNTKIPYEKLTDNNVRKFLQDKAKSNPVKHISDIKGTVFSYPTVTYSTWDSMKMPHLKNGKKTTLTIDTINFKFKGYNMRHPLYHAGFVYYDNNPVLNNVSKNPYAHELVTNGHYNFKTELNTSWDIYYSYPTSDYINYAVIWNNNIPGLSIHIYNPHKDDHILTFYSYDGTYSFIYTIFYPSFLHAEEVQKLRNMIEFFDSTNNPSFKLKEHVLFPDTEGSHAH